MIFALMSLSSLSVFDWRANCVRRHSFYYLPSFMIDIWVWWVIVLFTGPRNTRFWVDYIYTADAWVMFHEWSLWARVPGILSHFIIASSLLTIYSKIYILPGRSTLIIIMILEWVSPIYCVLWSDYFVVAIVGMMVVGCAENRKCFIFTLL